MRFGNAGGPGARRRGAAPVWRATLLSLLLLSVGTAAAQRTGGGAPDTPATGGAATQAPLGGGTARGVIPPPQGLDPGIRAPVPEPAPSTTPVIPPPGTPGGDPRVQPR